jgi:hypothetical protein
MGLGPGGSWLLSQKLKVRNREMIAQSRSKTAVVMLSMVNAASGSGGQSERGQS